MDPILEKVRVSSDRSFALKEEILPFIEIGWHFHPEYELTLFTESTGTRFIGDHIDQFGPGDLLLTGPNLPHYMRNDAPYYEGDPALRIRAIVVHFDPSFLGPSFFEHAELRSVKNLLKQSEKGLYFSASTSDAVNSKMESLLTTKGYPQLRCLLDILFELSEKDSGESLASISFRNTFQEYDGHRINTVYEYLLSKFQEEIFLSEVADLINMNTSAFCKFFKKRTGQTFTQTLNEIRIGHACKLLMNDSKSINEVCYRSGYNNHSYFNRKFKSITSFSPGAYRKKFDSVK